MIGIKDSLDEEDDKSKKVEEMLTGALENIDEGLEKFIELLDGRNTIKGKVVMEGSEDEA